MKAKLLRGDRKIAKKVRIEDEELAFLKPTIGERLQLIKEAKAAGLLNDEGEATNEEAAVRMMSTVIVTLLVDASGKKLMDQDWFEDALKEAQAVFSAGSVEVAKGE
jgi:hypothetical protein